MKKFLKIISWTLLGLIFGPLVVALGIAIAVIVILIVIISKIIRMITLADFREKRRNNKKKESN
ncbi:MAG: hypothetical protein KAS63_09925 [Candidatus Heimdallarchaeota archaeon]|nr:hypothetical protein [Candidatus Heimdallarchaeota archaeon]MCK4955669.1 hypothetical protein [Candidatus Heimdallarchaeota archaeon]